jgi:hypothetical protein
MGNRHYGANGIPVFTLRHPTSNAQLTHPQPVTMHGLHSGGPFPCSRGLTMGVSNPIKCWIENGESGMFGHPIRIHAIDFTYLPNVS